ncbi:MAG TPA: aldehyde dehydrogenase family protein, partial [Isosphaeraceae bacterium]|nr:aldehyde dehydrogenase family protein [Isosphaeraceae bacterium]
FEAEPVAPGAAPTTTSPTLVARNPATGAELGRVEPTTAAGVVEAVARARAAQSAWGALAWKDRRAILREFWAVLARGADDWAAQIRDEVGKPTTEAMVEVVAALDAVRWTVKNAGKVLADRPLARGWQRALLVPPGRLQWRPYGVVGMVATWNYPLFLTAPPIAQALATGNAVVWKPSESAMMSALRLQAALRAAGVPEGLVAAVFGGHEAGRSLIGSEIDLGMFTGGVDAGRSVLAELGRRGRPAIAELSGFDAAVVLPDAPLRSTARALAWGAFVNAGQTCVAVKRVYVVGDPAPMAEALAESARALRVGDPATATVDMGPLISSAARDRFDAAIRATSAAGARVLAGGAPTAGPGWFYAPTVLLADGPGPEAALAGAFGPVALVRGVADESAAIHAANAGPFGLSASVWGRDRRRARALAERLEAGMVAINDHVAPSIHAASPFGGVKASGFGRTKGALGLLAFAQARTLHDRPPGGLRPHLPPDDGSLSRLLALYRKVFHPR